MKEGRPSFTAVTSAAWRAAHLLLDEEPKLFTDSLALSLCGVANEGALRAVLAGWEAEVAQTLGPALAQKLGKQLRAFATMRSRYTEDELDKAIARGVSQYVILGAGLDSFAYRRPEGAEGVRVFEVDSPATQQWKQKQLHKHNVPVPSHVTFVPLDFETQPLMAALWTAGYQPHTPAFFSWLGVAQYLTEVAVFRTLQEVATSAPGSTIVFDYVVPESLIDDESRRLLEIRRASGTGRGEPWRSYFIPLSLVAEVRALGFTEVEDLSPEVAFARYFAGRTDGLSLSQTTHLLKAQVKTNAQPGRRIQ